MPYFTSIALGVIALSAAATAGIQAHGNYEQNKAAKKSTKMQADAQGAALNDAASQRREAQAASMRANRKSAIDMSALTDAARKTSTPTNLTGGAPIGQTVPLGG